MCVCASVCASVCVPLAFTLPLPRQVLHTGERAKGWGLFAARRIVRGEFLGHYSGVLVDIG